ncbi:uncharacterized protein Z518_04573 [Rhinocladiella mackenziei CBS 650.93]|uniref:BZIP domain-containing protein n=1 Tax=Rhinocladiella mackenziei CBS 650.93 TaxID=1442369 RepID=A0A0D2FWK5_9EURO|nr:uncharacterized protein Z518_04573 [Rhinocladiella mackenziei CBS 650.93]KIX06597.1 hypothetical protein Z518_04573 [Rhinocladiella mackenziei CBS 650.93]
MDSFISCFHASSLSSTEPQPLTNTNNYCYIPSQYWQTLDYYDMTMDICSDLPTDTVQIPPPLITDCNRLAGIAESETTLDFPLEFGLDANSSPGTDSLQLTHTASSIQRSPSAEPECPGHSPKCNIHNNSCEVCERDKKERRKEQNRKAQRNHRLRSEAKVEQLKARVKSQAEEIANLKEVNQSLMKHIESLRGEDKRGRTPDTGEEPDTDFFQQQISHCL